MEDLKMPNNVKPFSIPVLRKAIESQKVRGAYIMQDKAVVGRIYQMVCPHCQKVLTIKAKEAKPFVETCTFCNTKTVVTGYVATPKQEQPQPSAANSASVESMSDNGPTQKVRMHTGNIQTTGKLVWGGFLRRKNYILHEGTNYIGRNDSEIPSDVNIDDEYVSRRSILIEVARAPKGFTYKLTVKKCTNPVLINGKELAVGNCIYLNYGDTILVGNTTLTFKSAK